MLFNFQKFIQELRENTEKKEVIEKYEKIYGEINGDIVDQIWYTEYLSKFETLEVVLPQECKNDFDRNILMQLVAGSFSSEVMLHKAEDSDLTEMVISVDNDGKTIAKKVSELWGFQVDRLFQIYCEEQINLQLHIGENEKEKEEIISQRDYKFRKRGMIKEKLGQDAIVAQAQAEQSQKLDNLYDQL